MAVRSRLVWCVACVLAGCFGEVPPVDDGAAEATSSPGSTSTEATSDMPTSTSNGTTTTPPATSTSTTTPSSDTQTGPDSEPTTLAVTSDDPITSGSSSSSGDCHLLDFDNDMLQCLLGDLALPIGNYQVTFTNTVAASPTVCVEDVGGDDMQTAPLTGQYVYLQINSNEPGMLTFSAPVASLSFTFGPRHMEETAANTSVCVSTTPGSCDTTTASSNQDQADTIEMDLAGGTEAFLYLTKGVGNIGIDDLLVCFET